MKDVCDLLGIKKLNTTACHPQCNGMVERLNGTLKAMLRKHVVKFGPQWDQYLPGVLWAYRNTPHDATREKPSFLMFGVDLCSPTEAAIIPVETVHECDVTDYKQELILSLSSARELAVTNIKEGRQCRESIPKAKGWRLGFSKVSTGGEWEAAETVQAVAWTVSNYPEDRF